MKIVKVASVALFLVVLFCAGTTFAQSDPGVRGGAINGQAGATATSPLPLASVTTPVKTTDSPNAIAFFQNGLSRFQDVETINTGANTGLGPRFNFNQCSGCHSQPTIGGTGPANNPQFAAFQSGGFLAGSGNTLPSFITQHGPTREARFPFFFNSDGSANTNAPNGGVETIFVVNGLSGAANCSLTQPSFSAAASANDLIFRIPTPVFGGGLVENLDDSTLIAFQTSVAGNGFGVSGTFNHNGNDGTIARFGWKAQNKSLLLFSGEAYNVEMGISNELFTQDRPLPGEDQQGAGLPSTCLNLTGTGYPEDTTNFANTAPSGSARDTQDATILSDIEAFAQFMRLTMPPVPSTTTPGGASAISAGASLFNEIGCNTCHSPAVGKTQTSNITSSLSGQTVAAFSDFEIHHMGGLADNVSQGTAGGDQFRSAPLWGLGQRIFFLHDGRETNLINVINDHISNGSEASESAEEFFNNLSTTQEQEVLDFLRSL